MAHPMAHSLSEYVKVLHGCVCPTVTAAGAGDNTEVNGVGVDTKGYSSLVVAVTAKATLTDTKSMTVKLTVQDSADNSSFTDVADALQPGGAAASTVLTLTSAGGTTETGQYELGVNLETLRRYVRIQLLPDCTHSGTDTGTCAGVVILGGPDVLPAA